MVNTPLWLQQLGFELTGESRKPIVGEWYINRASNLLCFVYNKYALPCDCPKCNNGVRELCLPILDD